MSIAALIGWTQALAPFAAAAAAIMAAVAAWLLRSHVESFKNVAETQALLQIYQKWSEIFPAYRDLDSQKINWKNVIGHSTVDDYIASDDWVKVHRIFDFYELVSGCVKCGMFSRGTIFDVIVVNPEFWKKYELLIKYVRTYQNDNSLYQNAEQLFQFGEKKRSASRKAFLRNWNAPRPRAPRNQVPRWAR